MAERRDALKIIGAIGTTCAFPFSADELYGQHDHGGAKEAQLPSPSYFSRDELKQVSYVADLIIPRTDTPGAVDAGVPAYIDFVCARNPELGRTIRSGLREGLDLIALQALEKDGSPWLKAFKSVTADGYYTSKIGLLDELGYQGNTVLAAFPSCEIPEH